MDDPSYHRTISAFKDADYSARRLRHILARSEPDNGCLRYTGGCVSTGYGSVCFAGYNWLAHRLIWTLQRGPVPQDLTIDHLCKNKTCLNIDHMEIVTFAENSRRKNNNLTGLTKVRQIKRDPVHCSRGHEYGPQDFNRNGWRSCKRCDREQAVIRRQKRKIG